MSSHAIHRDPLSRTVRAGSRAARRSSKLQARKFGSKSGKGIAREYVRWVRRATTTPEHREAAAKVPATFTF